MKNTIAINNCAFSRNSAAAGLIIAIADSTIQNVVTLQALILLTILATSMSLAKVALGVEFVCPLLSITLIQWTNF